MADKRTVIVLALTFSCNFFVICCFTETNTNTIRQGQQVRVWNELISPNNVSSLKFFSLGNSRRYVGIFYENGLTNYSMSDFYGSYSYPSDKAVWVANRNNPIPDVSSNLQIDVDGKFSITYSGGTIVTLFDSTAVASNVSATLLDSGNFVLQEIYPDWTVNQVLWKSFDYPTDMFLPGMKLGFDFKNERNWSLTSWASDVLPASVSFTLTVDPNGTSQLVILKRGNVYWFSGPWKDDQFQNMQIQRSTQYLCLNYVSNETMKYLTYSKYTDGILPLMMFPDASLRGLNATYVGDWLLVVCTGNRKVNGCVESEYEESECRTPGDSFIGVKYFPPQRRYEEYDESSNLTLYECRSICWDNCSCNAFINTTENRTGCRIYSLDSTKGLIPTKDPDYYILDSYYLGGTLLNLLSHIMLTAIIYY